MKIFAISDVHGHYAEMQRALNKAGFDETDTNHLLVVCGDMFDRGRESLQVYSYLKYLSDLGKAVVIKGNHELMFIDYLTGKSVSPWNYKMNGENETFSEFLHETAPFETWCLFDNVPEPTYGDFAKWLQSAVKQINKEYPDLLPWLEGLPYYYETEHYIFTHGAIDTKAENWHEPHCEMHHYKDWEALAWNDGTFFGEDIKNTDKTVVIGHFSTEHLRKMYKLPYGEYKTLFRNDNRVIALDACTIVSKQVNILVVEEKNI